MRRVRKSVEKIVILENVILKSDFATIKIRIWVQAGSVTKFANIDSILKEVLIFLNHKKTVQTN